MENRQLSTPWKIFAGTFFLWEKLLDLLFPPRCISCKKEGSFFCAMCRERLPENNTIGVRGTISVWRYDNEKVRSALQQLKYRGKKMLARELAASLYDKLLETIAEEALFSSPITSSAKYLIVPVPSSKKRSRLRGYNQAELLAKELAALNYTLFDFNPQAVVKIKETKSQVSVKNREKRLQNLRGAFAVPQREKIRGKNVIIVDDITTTGATIAEVRKVLLEAGAKSVLGATIAH